MKAEIYSIGKDENIGLIPNGSKIKVYVLYVSDDGGEALVYTPPNTQYYDENEEAWVKDYGCGSVWVARKEKDYWVKSKLDYVNLSNKSNKEIKDLLSRRKQNDVKEKRKRALAKLSKEDKIVLNLI